MSFAAIVGPSSSSVSPRSHSPSPSPSYSSSSSSSSSSPLRGGGGRGSGGKESRRDSRRDRTISVLPSSNPSFFSTSPSSSSFSTSPSSSSPSSSPTPSSSSSPSSPQFLKLPQHQHQQKHHQHQLLQLPQHQHHHHHHQQQQQQHQQQQTETPTKDKTKVTIYADDIIKRLSKKTLQDGIPILYPGKDTGQVIFSFMEMKLNVSWDVVASNSPTAKTRLLICRVSDDTLMINGTEWKFKKEKKSPKKISGGGRRDARSMSMLPQKTNLVPKIDVSDEMLGENTLAFYDELLKKKETNFPKANTVEEKTQVDDSDFVTHLRGCISEEKKQKKEELKSNAIMELESKYEMFGCTNLEIDSLLDLESDVEELLKSVTVPQIKDESSL